MEEKHSLKKMRMKIISDRTWQKKRPNNGPRINGYFRSRCSFAITFSNSRICFRTARSIRWDSLTTLTVLALRASRVAFEVGCVLLISVIDAPDCSCFEGLVLPFFLTKERRDVQHFFRLLIDSLLPKISSARNKRDFREGLSISVLLFW